jgi:molybdopterin-biosynthesis enzyme MoeA-like protein
VVPRIGALIIGDEILSGKRADKHLGHVIATLSARGLSLAWARYEGDDRARLIGVLRETFAAGDIVFSFGGVGATPDDHTRQAAAAALGVPLVRHPEAVAELEARFGAEAWPHRVLMAEFPQGSTVIPNPVNRVASFSIHDHHFFPGFPQMAQPMLGWVLATYYPMLAAPPSAERTIVVFGAGESQLVPVMDENVARWPQLKLFSLPSFLPDGGRRIELGVRGDPALLEAAMAHLVAGVEAGGFRWEPLAVRAFPQGACPCFRVTPARARIRRRDPARGR